MDLLDLNVKFWDVEADSELDGGAGDELVDGYEKYN